ncbi:biotin synthase BioB [bacterium]|nr:biotin synthase BioB [bacterium]
MDTQRLIDTSLSGEALTRDDCRAVLAWPEDGLLLLLDAAWQVRRHFFGRRIHVQVLSNAKSGLCPEDCRYCSQSRVSQAEIETYPLISEEQLLAEGRGARDQGAKRFCMALSGRKPSPAELDRLCGMIRAVKADTGLELCGSLGLLDEAAARRLKEAGLDRVNHNLNTSERFHPEMCTTHTYQDRIDTIAACRAAGLEVCSGGIVGQGETDEDVIDLLLALRGVRPESIPINFLVPVPGTPFEDRATDLTPTRCLKILCLARLLNPDREIRAAGGRERHLRSLQPLAMLAANSIFVDGYLTTGGQPLEDALGMIADLGLELDTPIPESHDD